MKPDFESEFESDFESDFEFEFEFEEDDDRRDEKIIAPVVIDEFVVGSWVKARDLYAARALDIGKVIDINRDMARVQWCSDNLSLNYLFAELAAIAPTKTELESARSLMPFIYLPSIPRLDKREGGKIQVGDRVMTSSPYCRHGVQLGTIEYLLDGGRYVVSWIHIVGVKPRDSRRSFRPASWHRSDLIWAEVPQSISLSSKKSTTRKR